MLRVGDYLTSIALDDLHEFDGFGLRNAELVERVANFVRGHIELIGGQS